MKKIIIKKYILTGNFQVSEFVVSLLFFIPKNELTIFVSLLETYILSVLFLGLFLYQKLN
jgi:hypothetical protein